MIGNLVGAKLTQALAIACGALLLLLLVSVGMNVWQWRAGAATVTRLTAQLAGESAARTIDAATCKSVNDGANATAKKLQDLLLACRGEHQDTADQLRRALTQRELDRAAAEDARRRRNDAINRGTTDACPPAPVCRALSDQLLGRPAAAADQRADDP